jgi:two-component system sensor histidine kinase RegB
VKEFTKDANRKNLLQLLKLRAIATVGQIVAILIAYYFLEIDLPISQMFLVLAILSVISLKSFFQKNVSDKTLFIELIFDVAALTAQLYLSGGASNPFISLFLLQVIIAAILLKKIHAWLIAAITVFCYIWLGFYSREMHEFHHHASGDFFNLHLQGMLISYILAAILLLIFITKISQNLRERDQMIRMAMLATSAAHELGTPLSTISVVIGDWKKIGLDKDLSKDVALIESQLSRCKKIISAILAESGSKRVEEAKDL